MEFSIELEDKISEIDRKIQHIQEQLMQTQPNYTLTQFRQSLVPMTGNIHMYYRLESHSEKIYSLSWAGSGSSRNPEAVNMLATVSNDGDIIIWNVAKLKPIHKVNIRSDDPWLMTCTFEKREGVLLATGGIEGRVYIYQMGMTKAKQLTMREHPKISFQAHTGYISSCEFLTSIDLLTGSGDSTCKLWNLDVNNKPVRVFSDHTDDIMTIAACPMNSSLFLTGGCDKMVRVWDIREKKGLCHSYQYHQGHVNFIRFFHSSSHTFATACSDGAARVFDLRAIKPLGVYQNERNLNSLTSVALSQSGRLLFTSDETGKIVMWDTFDERISVQNLTGHTEQATCMEISPLGNMMASGSYDKTVLLWKTFATNFQ